MHDTPVPEYSPHEMTRRRHAGLTPCPPLRSAERGDDGRALVPPLPNRERGTGGEDHVARASEASLPWQWYALVAETHALLMRRTSRDTALAFVRHVDRVPNVVVRSTRALEARAVVRATRRPRRSHSKWSDCRRYA